MINFKNKELMYIIIERNGGKTSSKIIDELLKRPYNINQIARNLNMDYNTVHYHIKVIENYNFIFKPNNRHGSPYYPTKKLIKNINEYEKLKKYL